MTDFEPVQLSAYMVRLRQALGLPRAEYEALRLPELTQFAFAKGEETVIRLSGQADATFKAVDAAFSDNPDEVFSANWIHLMSKVYYQKELTENDYVEHNRRMAEQFTSQTIN